MIGIVIIIININISLISGIYLTLKTVCLMVGNIVLEIVNKSPIL